MHCIKYRGANIHTLFTLSAWPNTYAPEPTHNEAVNHTDFPAFRTSHTSAQGKTPSFHQSSLKLTPHNDRSFGGNSQLPNKLHGNELLYLPKEASAKIQLRIYHCRFPTLSNHLCMLQAPSHLIVKNLIHHMEWSMVT